MMGPSDRIALLLAEGVCERAWPGAVLGVTDAHRSVLVEAAGCRTYTSPRRTRADDIFDLASLSKVVGTTTAVMRLCDTGMLSLDRRVVDILPAFALDSRDAALRELRGAVTVRHLLAHASGLPAYVPFHRDSAEENDQTELVVRTGLTSAPGSREVYSDVGMMVLGLLIEKLSGSTLDRLLSETVFAPLGMADTGYCPHADAVGERIVPTEIKPGSTVPLHGVVHDENARWFGGVAGHAGLFSTVADLLCFSRMLLNRGVLGGVRIASSATLAVFTRRVGIVPGSSRCLGWDSPSGESSGGAHLSGSSFGHTGFTGTSLWIDPEHGLGVVLLSNAVHPHRDCRSRAFFGWRRRMHSAVYEYLVL
jgi:CubicO group peptidase (beta-lactamase class C family)